jgi:hypothetical protein
MEFALIGPKNLGIGRIGVPDSRRKVKEPDWTDGLRRLYDSIIDEPLPQSFAELLKRLDDDDDGK